MSMLIRPGAVRQPPSEAPLALSSPLARGLVGYLQPGRGIDQFSPGTPWEYGARTLAGGLVGPASMNSGRFDTTPRANWRIAAPVTVALVMTRTALYGGTTGLLDLYGAIGIGERYGTGTRDFSITTTGTSFAGTGGSGEWALNRPFVAIVTYDGATGSLYDSGTLVGSGAASGALSYGTFGFSMVAAAPAAGAVAGLALWSRVLSEAEIRSLSANPWQLFAPPARRLWGTTVAGGATYYQTAGGVLVPAGALLKKTKTTEVGSLTGAGTAVRKTRARRGGLLTPSATATKRTRDNVMTGSVTPSGTLSARFVLRRALAGSLTVAGALRRKVLKRATGALTASGALLKKTRRALAGSLTVAGTVRKLVRRRVQGAITGLGAMATRFVTRKTLLGSTTLAGAVARVFLPFIPSTPGDGSNKSSLMGTHRRR